MCTKLLKWGDVDHLMLRGKQDTTLYTSYVGDEILRAGRGQEGSTRGVRADGFGRATSAAPATSSIRASHTLVYTGITSLEHFWQSGEWKLESRNLVEWVEVRVL